MLAGGTPCIRKVQHLIEGCTVSGETKWRREVFFCERLGPRSKKPPRIRYTGPALEPYGVLAVAPPHTVHLLILSSTSSGKRIRLSRVKSHHPCTILLSPGQEERTKSSTNSYHLSESVWAAITVSSPRGGSNPRRLFLRVLEAGSLRSGSAWSGSGGSSLPNLQAVTFSPCAHVDFSQCMHEGRELFLCLQGHSSSPDDSI